METHSSRHCCSHPPWHQHKALSLCLSSKRQHCRTNPPTCLALVQAPENGWFKGSLSRLVFLIIRISKNPILQSMSHKVEPAEMGNFPLKCRVLFCTEFLELPETGDAIRMAADPTYQSRRPPAVPLHGLQFRAHLCPSVSVRMPFRGQALPIAHPWNGARPGSVCPGASGCRGLICQASGSPG